MGNIGAGHCIQCGLVTQYLFSFFCPNQVATGCLRYQIRRKLSRLIISYIHFGTSVAQTMWRFSASSTLKVKPEVVYVIMALLTAVSSFIQQRPLSIRALILLRVSGRRAVCCHTFTKRGSCFILCPTPSGIKSSPAQTQHGLDRTATYGLSTLCTSASMMGGEMDLFSQRHPDKDRDWEGIEIWIRCLSLSRFASFVVLLFFLFFLFFSFFPIIISPRVCETEKCLQNCCAAPWLWSCMSTLWAPISATMTGTCVNEWHPAPCY